MSPSIPTYRPVVTPSRFAWVLAVAALASNLYLMLDDALAASPNAATTELAAAAAACNEREDQP